jgi:hypothetical protein
MYLASCKPPFHTSSWQPLLKWAYIRQKAEKKAGVSLESKFNVPFDNVLFVGSDQRCSSYSIAVFISDKKWAK